MAHRAAVCGVCAASRRAHRGWKVEGIGRRILDGDSVRHRRAAGADVSDRQQCDQRPDDRRECTGIGGVRAGECSGFRVQGSGQRAEAEERVASPHHSPLTTHHSLSCAIAYDTRHNSRHFAELCAEIMVANGFRVYFLDDYRSTPELSFLVRHKAVRLRDHGHGQPQSAQRQRGQGLLVHRRSNRAAARSGDRRAGDERGRNQASRFRSRRRGWSGRAVQGRDRRGVHPACRQPSAAPAHATSKIIYSPLHGVGEFAAVPALKADGFTDVEIYAAAPRAQWRFSECAWPRLESRKCRGVRRDHRTWQATGADLILATDPDCDRMGCRRPAHEGQGRPTGARSPATSSRLC